MAEFRITPIHAPEEAYTVQADRYEYSETTGRHLFYNGEGDASELVANEINVRVRKVEASNEPDPQP